MESIVILGFKKPFKIEKTPTKKLYRFFERGSEGSAVMTAAEIIDYLFKSGAKYTDYLEDPL